MTIGGLSSIVSRAPRDDLHAFDGEARARAQSRALGERTQQSWQAPIRQNPARGPSPNSDDRSRRPLVSNAVSSMSPASASQEAAVDDETNPGPIVLEQASELRRFHSAPARPPEGR